MKYLFSIVFIALLFSCQTETITGEAPIIGNPPMEGFNEADSDEQAIDITDQVMTAMGGRAAWDNTRYIAWNFFGRRDLFWDKQTGDVQIDLPSDELTIFLNVHQDGEGVVHKNGEPYTQADSIQYYTKRGKSIWINDSYWLVMPFKLKDSGVTLTYEGQDTTSAGEAAEVLALTFEEVGDTPENKYLVYVTPTDSLIKQWDFYRNASDSLPSFATPWANYQPYGDILLSDNRGERGLSDIAVYDELPNNFEWIK
ncbi:MAG: hypothetical protein AAGI23_15090 [Bacteroidota bacterium]